ncbi:MAG: CRISPR-associated protein Cas4 [Bacteroidales bacterium]|nr:CRISPR-associated protein Cas4 [Bacteroidales bacterium]
MQEDDMLLLSGIQHIAFCERQWALIHIEQQWSENVLTVEGHHLHERVDNPVESDKRGDVIVLRAVTLSSKLLGLNGRADVVELRKVANNENDNAISLDDHCGRWKVIPVEYKRGEPKPDERDEVQLCAQAMCLEEMHQVKIDFGFLYYGETRRRVEVDFSEGLRALVREYSERMHELYDQGITPLPVYKSHCKSCSLLDICLPKSLSYNNNVETYLESNFWSSE